MRSNVAISVSSLGKCYRHPRGVRSDSVRDAITSLFSRSRRETASTRPTVSEFWALQDVGFEVDAGETVGVLGLNGAGKSTLLKILSRITSPTTGRASIRGRLGALLEVGTGFHPDLTGRENVYLYGAILGMGRAEVCRKFEAIVDFAEVADFIDTPVKRYSSGMYVRLAFSVAAHLHPDILLLDEVLAVGDFTFQKKCTDLVKSLENSGATILLVSHNMFSIKAMCDRVLYLKGGRLEFDGDCEAGLALYERAGGLPTSAWFAAEEGAPRIEVTEAILSDEYGTKRSIFDHGQRLRLRFRYHARTAIKSPNFLISFTRSDGVLCCNFSSTIDGAGPHEAKGDGEIELLTPPITLVADSYTIQIVVREGGFHRMLSAQTAGTFHIRDPLLSPTGFGVFHQRAIWRETLDLSIPRPSETPQRVSLP
jgi:lipopolysaccharide transport system ATP-binding protein